MKEFLNDLKIYIQRLVMSRKTLVFIIATILLAMGKLDPTAWVAAGGVFVAGSIIDDYLTKKTDGEGK